MFVLAGAPMSRGLKLVFIGLFTPFGDIAQYSQQPIMEMSI